MLERQLCGARQETWLCGIGDPGAMVVLGGRVDVPLADGQLGELLAEGGLLGRIGLEREAVGDDATGFGDVVELQGIHLGGPLEGGVLDLGDQGRGADGLEREGRGFCTAPTEGRVRASEGERAYRREQQGRRHGCGTDRADQRGARQSAEIEGRTARNRRVWLHLINLQENLRSGHCYSSSVVGSSVERSAFDARAFNRRQFRCPPLRPRAAVPSRRGARLHPGASGGRPCCCGS